MLPPNSEIMPGFGVCGVVDRTDEDDDDEEDDDEPEEMLGVRGSLPPPLPRAAAPPVDSADEMFEGVRACPPSLL